MALYLHDLGDGAIVKQLIPPAAIRTSTVTGATTFDFLQGDGQCVAVLNVGAVTDGTFATAINESTDGITFTAVGGLVPSTGFATVTTGSGASTPQVVSFNRTKRYLQAVITVTGSPSTGGYFDVVAFEQQKFVG